MGFARGVPEAILESIEFRRRVRADLEFLGLRRIRLQRVGKDEWTCSSPQGTYRIVRRHGSVEIALPDGTWVGGELALEA